MPPLTPSAFGPVYDLAVLLLGQLVAGYAAATVELPERQYVTPGIVPAYDDPQLTVSVQALRVGVPGAAIGAAVIRNCPTLLYVSFRVELIRCTPALKANAAAPSPAELLASAGEVLRDLFLVDSIVRGARETLAGKGEAADGIGVPVAMTGTSPVGPDGGLAGVRVDIDVPL